MHLVPHHSRRLSSPYHSTVFRFTSLPRIQTLFTVYLKHLVPRHRVLHILRRLQSLLAARMSVLHCRPCYTPTHHRIPLRRTSTAHSIDIDHAHSTDTILIKRALICLTEVANSGYYY
jgi:hypothetical protein